jgi:acyl-CoA synthetase (AMP-forming)/AMP-acid ligase II
VLSVEALLRQHACAGRLSIVEGATGEGVMWAEVAELADRWRASRLVGPIGVALADPVAMAANFVAALAAGVLVAPLDPTAPLAEMAASARRLGLRSLVVGAGQAGPDGLETWHAGRWDLRRLAGQEAPLSALPDAPRAVAALMASSGTTGSPKIIPLTDAQLTTTAGTVARELRLTPAERGYSPLPLFHINGLVVGVLSALVAGSTIVVERQFSRSAFWSTVERRAVTWLNLVPAMLSILSSSGPEPTGTASTRLARSASAPLPGAVRQRFETLTGVPVIETYGMTEAASQITANPLGAVRAGSVGRPVDVGLRVVGDRVQIRGERVTQAYWSFEDGRWSSRAATDGDGWLDTGDIGHVDADGYLYLTGREGDNINRGGEKVQPREVEEVLLSDRRVTAAVVVPRPHPIAGEEPVAFVLATDAGLASPEALSVELRRLCETNLSRFKRPAEIVVARSLPAGPTGKVRRREVRAMAASPTHSAPQP